MEQLRVLHAAAKGCEFDLTPQDGPIAKLVLFFHAHGDAIVAALRSTDQAVERARKTVRDALMDSQYLAGATAGWNAAQTDDPEAAFAALQKSREGHMSGYAEAKRTLAIAALHPTDPAAIRNAALEEAARVAEAWWPDEEAAGCDATWADARQGITAAICGLVKEVG